jgi:hypothetical protein
MDMKLSALYLAGIVTVFASPALFAQATSENPATQTKRTVEETRIDPSGATNTTRTTTTTTTTAGKVETYTAGKSVTVLKPDGSRETYVINPESTVPNELAVGGNIVIMPASPGEHTVRSITIKQ